MQAIAKRAASRAVTFRAAALLLLCLPEASGQAPAVSSRHLISEQAYHAALDEVFPRGDAGGLDVEYQLILRFEPSRHLESQIVIRAFADRRVEAVLYQPVGRSVWDVSNEQVVQGGTDSVTQIASRVRVQRQDCGVSWEVAHGWQSSFFQYLASSLGLLRAAARRYERTGTSEVVLDGTRYELWYTQGMVQLHWRFMDVEVDDSGATGSAPLPRLMNDVRLYAAEHANRKPNAP
jgi:hypothetical protein